VDYSGKGEYFPTLYVIAEFPELVKPLIINIGVEKYILNGANLMWPGVLYHENFKKDDFTSIVTVDGRYE
jgi:predicted RNA-binding protein (TIGR00451 family)